MSNDQQYDQGELGMLTDALASQGTDELRITEASALDISDRAPREIGKARMQDSGGVLIDPATDTTLTNTLAREIATWTAGTLPVEQQTPVAVEDSTGTQVDPAANLDGASTSADSSTAGTPAAASLPDGRTDVTAAWDVSGSATVTVEVSHDGGTTWFQEYTVSPGSAETGTYNFTTGFDDVRVTVDTNLNTAAIGGKGA